MKKRKIGFSVLDMVLLVLAAACILSSVFQDQIRSFLGESKGEKVEITFLVENVTEEGKNHPLAGEEILLTDTRTPVGTLLSVTESKSVYENVSDPEDEIEVLTLTCKVISQAEVTESGYQISGVMLKPGASLSVETPTASFVMLVTMVKTIEND